MHHSKQFPWNYYSICFLNRWTVSWKSEYTRHLAMKCKTIKSCKELHYLPSLIPTTYRWSVCNLSWCNWFSFPFVFSIRLHVELQVLFICILSTEYCDKVPLSLFFSRVKRPNSFSPNTATYMPLSRKVCKE